jgi:hypothetical protein
MNRHGVLKRRVIADFLLVCAFALAAPLFLAPISRSWSLMVAGFVTFLFSVGFLLDALRTLQRLRSSDGN